MPLPYLSGATRMRSTAWHCALRNLGDPDSAREATQEVFMRAWQKRGRWRLGLGKPFTWLHGSLEGHHRAGSDNSTN